MRGVAAAITAVAAAIATLGPMLLMHGEARAQAACDPSLRALTPNSGYRLRDDRCEGLYSRNVSSYGIKLMSFTSTAPVDDLCIAGRAVHLVWPTYRAAETPIQLHVESLRSKLDYAMTSRRPANTTSYEWPTDPRCNSNVLLRGPELAMLARTQGTVGSQRVNVLLPMTVAAAPSAPVRPPYRIVLMPGRRVREIYVSLWHYADGITRREVVSDRALGRAPYVPRVHIVAVLSAADVAQPGLYRVKLSVEFESGPPDAFEEYFISG
jgi:hypothetical protein